jgi:hypothetical protein
MTQFPNVCTLEFENSLKIAKLKIENSIKI